jgi:hypothetical protein
MSVKTQIDNLTKPKKMKIMKSPTGSQSECIHLGNILTLEIAHWKNTGLGIEHLEQALKNLLSEINKSNQENQRK